jgi:hypothetical protein
MSISKKLFHHSSNSHFHSYLLAITVFMMLLSMAGCDACGDTSGDVQYATDLDIKFTPERLYGAKRKAVLTISTKGGNNEVARFTDFDLAVSIKATGKDIGNSLVKYTGYNPDTESPEKKEVTLTTGKPLDISKKESLYRFFVGGRDGSFEFKQYKRNDLEFEIIPDLSSGVESISITVTVSSHVADAAGIKFQKDVKAIWERSPYKLTIEGLDNGVIQPSIPCKIQVTRRDKQAITEEELGNLYVAVEQDHQGNGAPHLYGVDEGVMTFQAGELKGTEVAKQLIVLPGTIKDMVTFSLSLYQNDETESAAIVKAKYHPVVLPCTLKVDKNELIGPGDKAFKVVVEDVAGNVLDL